MIEVGESSGALAPMLTSVAEFYEEEVNLRLGAMVSLIEPAILIFMDCFVAFILISLYLPISRFQLPVRPAPLERNPWERHTKTSRSTAARLSALKSSTSANIRGSSPSATAFRLWTCVNKELTRNCSAPFKPI